MSTVAKSVCESLSELAKNDRSAEIPSIVMIIYKGAWICLAYAEPLYKLQKSGKDWRNAYSLTKQDTNGT